MSQVRRYALKAVPYEAQPKNKYNAVVSAYNIKPVPTPGLIHNPPAAAPTPTQTPRPFLPANDPRLKVFADTFKVYTASELEEMPLIYATQKDRLLTREMAEQMVALRREDPAKWTVARLAQKFDVDRKKVNVVTGTSAERQAALRDELARAQSKWKESTRVAKEDRTKRKHMWLSNAF